MANQEFFQLGWVQREPRHLLQPGELLEALNLIPNDLGAISTRLGHTLVVAFGALDDVTTLYVTADFRGGRLFYNTAGTVLYRNHVPILTQLLDGVPVSMASMRGFGEQASYTFFAASQDVLRVKDNGDGITRWGLAPPTVSPIVVSLSASGAALLAGSYMWRQTFVRKPLISNTVLRLIAAGGTYTIVGMPQALSTGTINDGLVLSADEPFAEAVLYVTAGTAGTYLYAYWGGTQWNTFTPDVFPTYTVTDVTALRFSFPVSNWIPYNGKYRLLIQTIVAPATSPFINAVKLYDSPVAAESTPSPMPLAPTAVTVGNRANLTMADASIAGANFDPQVTHVFLYRTRGDDPAFATPGLVIGQPLFFYETEQPIGKTAQFSIISDDQLQELMELDNDRPLLFSVIAEYQERLFGAVGNRLYFSKRALPEAFPALNYREVSALGDPIVQMVEYDGLLYLFTGTRVFLLQGTDEDSYDPRPLQCPVGLGAAWSVGRGQKGLYFLGSDGNLWRIQGSSTAVNLSQDTHYPFFHGDTFAGVPPLAQDTRSSCVGMWANNRYYLSYPTGLSPTPTTTFVIDEGSDTWWRDSRGFRALYYDRARDRLLGSDTTGHVYQMEQETTDNGAPIAWVVQTRDEDEGAPDSEKDLVQLTVEANPAGGVLTVEAVPDYGVGVTVLLGTCLPTIVRAQTSLTTGDAGSPRAKAWGVRLSGIAPMVVYRLLPQVVVYPLVRVAWDSLPTILGVPGPKWLVSLLLDVDLRSGTLECQLWADSARVETFTLATLGRQQVQVLRQAHPATTVELFLLALDGSFLLYPASLWGFRTTPAPTYGDVLLPSDLGSPQDKAGMALTLDIALLAPGACVTEFVVDGTVVHSVTTTQVGRARSQRHRLPGEGGVGRLLEVRRRSDVPFEDWGGELFYAIAGQPGWQTTRLAPGQYGQYQQVPLLGG